MRCYRTSEQLCALPLDSTSVVAMNTLLKARAAHGDAGTPESCAVPRELVICESSRAPGAIADRAELS